MEWDKYVPLGIKKSQSQKIPKKKIFENIYLESCLQKKKTHTQKTTY